MKDIYLTDKQYRKALLNLRALLVSGIKLSYFDDTTLGNKDTQCTWGLCSDSNKIWSEAEMCLWPEEFKRGKGTPKYLKNHQICPLLNVEAKGNDGSGCFYFCRIFKNKKKPFPTREEVINRIDELLKQ